MNQNHRKKLLIVLNNFLTGGAERLMLDILSRLDRDKFSIEIVTVIGMGPLEGEFRSLGFPIYSVGPNLDQGKKLFSKVRWVILAPLTLWRLVGIMKKTKPDLVLTSLYQADLLGIWAAKIARVKKRIFIQHDVIYLPLARRIFKKWLSIKLSTQIIAVSETVRDFMVNRWMVSEDKITVVYNGVDFKKFNTSRKFNNVSTVGIVGRLEKVKGPDIFAKAILELKEKYSIEPNVLFVGDGSMKESLKKLTGNQLEKVNFVESVSNAQDWLFKIDLLVVPSRSEGFGLILVEGLLSKCLIVASDIPAFREIIDGENGLLFPVGDYKTLARLLADILKDPQRQNTLRTGVDKWVKKESYKFNIEGTVKAYEAILS